MNNYPLVQKSIYIVGIGLLLLATLLAAASWLGWLTVGDLLPGESSVHTIARVAVLGCVLAALGSINK